MPLSDLPELSIGPPIWVSRVFFFPLGAWEESGHFTDDHPVSYPSKNTKVQWFEQRERERKQKWEHEDIRTLFGTSDMPNYKLPWFFVFEMCPQMFTRLASSKVQSDSSLVAMNSSVQTFKCKIAKVETNKWCFCDIL